MAKQPLSLILILSISSILITTVISVNPYTQTRPNLFGSSKSYIRVSCRATLYPSLCYQTLSRYSNIIQNSPRKLAAVALAVSLSRARTTATYITKMSKIRGIGHREISAIKDCVDTMGDTVDQLSRSMKELGRTRNRRDFMWHMSNVQTWVSAALTNEDTCVDGFSSRFMDGRIKDGISLRVNNVAQITSNALALVNRFASRHKLAYHVTEP